MRVLLCFFGRHTRLTYLQNNYTVHEQTRSFFAAFTQILGRSLSAGAPLTSSAALRDRRLGHENLASLLVAREDVPTTGISDLRCAAFLLMKRCCQILQRGARIVAISLCHSGFLLPRALLAGRVSSQAIQLAPRRSQHPGFCCCGCSTTATEAGQLSTHLISIRTCHTIVEKQRHL